MQDVEKGITAPPLCPAAIYRPPVPERAVDGTGAEAPPGRYIRPVSAMPSIHSSPLPPARVHDHDDVNSSSGFSNSSDSVVTEWTPKADRTILGAFLVLFCTFGQMNSFGTYQTWYKQNQLNHLAPSTISWIGSLQLWVFFFSGGPIGRLFDRFGPRWLIGVGSVVFVLAIMLTSVSGQFYQYLLVQGVLFGLGAGLLFYPSLASISTHISKYRATALGIATAGSSVGGVVYPIMLDRLFVRVGFQWGVRVSGLVSAACCIAALLTVTAATGSRKKTCPKVTIWTFTDTPYVLLAIGSSLVALGLFVPFFYLGEYTHSIVSPSSRSQFTFYILAVLNAGGILGRIAPAYLSDRLGRFNILFPSAFLSGLSILIFWMSIDFRGEEHVKSESDKLLAPLIVFALVYGFLSGAFISVITPCIAQISELAMVGSRIGVLYSFISFPSLVGGPAAGAILVRDRGSYSGMIAFSGSAVVAGSFFILLTRLTIDRHIFSRV